MKEINNLASGLKAQIENEIRQFLTEQVDLGNGIMFSQNKLVRRISLFETHTYPTGKFDSEGDYKFWFDIVEPRIDSEVKNIDFDTNAIDVYSPRKVDELPCIITNLKVDEYLRVTGQAEEINSAIEEGSGWGNIVWKKVKGSYERVDLRNFYVINQRAACLDETPVIERHSFMQSDLRAMSGKWKNVQDVIDNCGSKTYKSSQGDQSSDTTVPYYEVFERNGEVCVKDLKELFNDEVLDGDDKKYTFAKIIAAGTKESAGDTVKIEYILFAQEMKGKTNYDIYKEYHRGRYKGRWWREGIYELLFDCQVRGNQIGNQIAKGLAFASKLILRSQDKLIIQNVMSDMVNGGIIRSQDLQQVDLRMHAFDQLLADWNRNIQLANSISNSMEVIMGENTPSGQPLGTTQLVNVNANKLYDFIREKLAIPYSQIFEEWLIPELVSEITAEEVVRLTGDSDMLKRLAAVVVEDWYIQNLIAIGPHTADTAITLKTEKLDELMSRPQLLMTGISDLFDDFKPNVSVNITGEQVNLPADLQNLQVFAGLEQDPVRRSAIIELMARKKGLDFGSLPKSPPQALPPSPMQVTNKQPVAAQ